MHMPGLTGIIVVSVVVILLFGRGKISGLMGEVASGIKSFKNGMKDDVVTQDTGDNKLLALAPQSTTEQ